MPASRQILSGANQSTCLCFERPKRDGIYVSFRSAEQDGFYLNYNNKLSIIALTKISQIMKQQFKSKNFVHSAMNILHLIKRILQGEFHPAKKFLYILLVSVCSSFIYTTVYGQDTVVIIRHGEKPAKGDNLCPKGLNRALALPAVLSKKFSIPMYTYVPAIKTGQGATETSDVRMFQTVTPFAVQYNLTVNSAYKKSDIKGITKDVLSNLKKDNPGIILLVWEHKNIQPIAVAMGISNAPQWDDCDFDGIWIITHAGKKSAQLFKASEGLNGVGGACDPCK